MTTLYTIGHSNHTLEHFLELLQRHAITTIVDVRSHPYSKWTPHFQKDALALALEGAGIEHVFLGQELGGRPHGAQFYDSAGHLDLASRARARDFQSGIERLIQLALTRRTAMLCAEENPNRCHRRRLVTPAVEAREASVTHIRGDGRLQPEAELRDEERRSASPQLPLFGDES